MKPYLELEFDMFSYFKFIDIDLIYKQIDNIKDTEIHYFKKISMYSHII